MIKKGFLIFNISYLFLIKLKLRLIFYKFLNCYIPSNDTNKLLSSNKVVIKINLQLILLDRLWIDRDRQSIVLNYI